MAEGLWNTLRPRSARLALVRQLELLVEVKRVTVGISEFLATESGLAVVAQGVTQERLGP